MISSLLPALALASGAAAKGIWVTPHDSYSSSIGVLGCKINTDRVAYWPSSVGCDNICVKVTHEGRSVHLLKIDQSGGAYDISYDAWNYLQTGKSAATDPIAGGTVPMDYEDVPAEECAHLLTDGGKLPLSASNSMNYVTSCLSQPSSFVAKNHVLYNICDSICSLGHDEKCSLDLAVSNQPACSHTLGLTSPLKSAPVFNIMYQTGKTVNAATGEAAGPRARPADPVVPVVEKPAPAPVVSKPAPVVPVQTPGVFKELEDTPVAPSSTAAAASSAPASTWAHGRPGGASATWTKVASTATIVPVPLSTGAPVGPNSNGTHPVGQPVPHSTFLVVASSAPAAQPTAGGAREVVASAGRRASTSLLLAAGALLGSLLMI